MYYIIRISIFFSLILINVSFCDITFAITYSLTKDLNRLVGCNKVITVPKDNIQSLEYFAAKYQLGLSNILEANPSVDPFLPKSGTILNIPHQLILPNTIHEGIIINSAEMRLYYYPKNSNSVTVLPIGIGQLKNATPTNWITKIKRKKINPTWIPTAKIRAEYAAIGESLPKIVLAGSNNPMGPYALYIGNLYAIHGTNSNFGIGLRVSHGCVRLRNNDIKFLFKNVPIGTRVQFINEPVKFTTEFDGSSYIEVHNPLSNNEEQITKNKIVPINSNKIISSIIKQSNINIKAVKLALYNRSGMPIRLN